MSAKMSKEEREELLKEFEAEFDSLRKELKVMATLGELDEVFYLRDFALEVGFVSNHLSRGICRRIADLYMNWLSYIHGLVIPNPNSLPNVTESQMFDEQEKEGIMKFIGQLMELISRNSLIGLKKDKAEEGKFMDDALKFWNETFTPKLTVMMKKVNTGWKEKPVAVKQKKPDTTFG